ncbi:MAG: Rab family GTPase [Promethearchaeota archaeon]
MPVYKIAIVGDGGVGKSSLLEAKHSQTFDTRKEITIGVDFKLIPLNNMGEEKKPSSFLAMDLGGQERFQFMHDSYIKGIKAALIMYDVTRYKSFYNIGRWYDLIQHENNNIPVLIIGNKIDLIDSEQQEESRDDLDELIKDIPNNENVFGPFFTSAKDMKGIEEIFAICEEMILLNI